MSGEPISTSGATDNSWSLWGTISKALNLHQASTSHDGTENQDFDLCAPSDSAEVSSFKQTASKIFGAVSDSAQPAASSSYVPTLAPQSQAESTGVLKSQQLDPALKQFETQLSSLSIELYLLDQPVDGNQTKKTEVLAQLQRFTYLLEDLEIPLDSKTIAFKQLGSKAFLKTSSYCGIGDAISTLLIAKESASEGKKELFSTICSAKKELVQTIAEDHLKLNNARQGNSSLEVKRLVFLASEICGYSCEDLTEDEKKYIVEPSKYKTNLEAFLVKAKHGTELYHVAQHESIKCAQKLSIDQNETALVMHEHKPGHSLDYNFEKLTVNESNSKELCLLSGMSKQNVETIMSEADADAESEITLEGRCFYKIANNLAKITDHEFLIDWKVNTDVGDSKTLAHGESRFIKTHRKMHFYVVFNSHSSGGMETTVRRPISINDLRHSEGIFSESPEVIRTMVNQAVAQTSDCQQLIDFANNVIFNSLCNYQMNAHKTAREGFAVMREAFTAALQAKLKNKNTLDEITRYVYDTGNGVGSGVPKPKLRDEWVAICNHPAITAIQLKSQFNKSAPFKHNHIPTITVDVAEEFSNEELTTYFSEEVRDLMFREAVIYNKRLLADKLQKAGAKVAKCDSLGFYPVSLAAMHGHKDTLEYLKSAPRVKFSQADSEKRSPTYLAARFNHPEALSYLLTFKTLAGDPNDPATDGDTPLLSATRMGHLEICNALINETRVKLIPTGFDNQSVLHVCCMKGNQALHDLFEEKRSNEYGRLISSRDSNQRTPRMCALQNGHQTLANKINH